MKVKTAVLGLVAGLIAVGSVALAEELAPTARPVHRLDWKESDGSLFWKIRHEKKLAEIAKGGGKFDFVLLGDSITHNWEAGKSDGKWGKVSFGKFVAEERFSGYSWLDLGQGGDGTEQVIWRCLNGELDGFETRLVNLLIGTNNRYSSAEEVALGVKRILEVVREKQPKATILLNAILPRMAYPDDPCDLRAKNDRTNELIRRYCDGKNVIWLDWGGRILGADGTVGKKLMFDEVHPAAPGYEAWADAMMPYIRKFAYPKLGSASLNARFVFDERTGTLVSLAAQDGRSVVCGLENRYKVMAKSGDVEAVESEDVVATRRAGDGWVEYDCTNPKMPGMRLRKRYVVENGGIRRTLTFANDNAESRYVTPFTECRLTESFRDKAYHFGAGYLGPYRPFRKLPCGYPVTEYRQSSKGLVFVNPDGRRGCYSHYLAKIDDTVVLPWWHSTIGHYREYHDRLWFTPEGYKMGLGTFGIYRDKPVSLTDQFNFFDGNLFTFFDRVFATDKDVAAEFASIPPPPAWISDLGAMLTQYHDDFVRWLGAMLDDCEFLGTSALVNSWADYRLDRPIQGEFGGHLTKDEIAAYVSHLKDLNPRMHPSFYHIVVSAGKYTRILQERPEWFRRKDRDGLDDSLFPHLCENFQTMFSEPECRQWLADMLIDFERSVGSDTVYTDETQMTNTIDWEHDRVTRDDDVVKFWRLLKKRLQQEKMLYFANGSGLPYVDLNFMESPDEMAPSRWRDWAGVALGIGMISRMREGQRTIPLYWTPQCDYVNRVLALGWIPAPYEGVDRLMPVRAAHQYGKLVPCDVRYTPDWKTDPVVEVESHSTKRTDARDVVVSFINRGAACDLPVTIDLSTLGFAADERINVWRTHFDADRAKAGPHLSDAELRCNWRTEGSIDGATLFAPELVYSGPAKGTFENTVKGIGKDRMEQFLVTAAPAQFFAANDVPLNTFFTAQKKCRIRGRKVSLGRRADILLADRHRVFTDVTANGKPVPVRNVATGGLVFQLVTLEPGEWTLGWKTVPRKGTSLVAELPSAPKARTSSVPPLVLSHLSAPTSTVRAITKKVGSVEIREARTYQSPFEDTTDLQRNISAGIANADAESLVLEAGTSRRDVKTRILGCWAGFELSNARQVRIRLSHTFGTAHSLDFGHVWAWGPGELTEFFTGFVFDYRVNGKYVKRVSMSTGLFNPKSIVRNPPWGCGAKVADLQLTFGSWIDEPSPREFSLDLTKFAPEGWDGTVYFTLGEERLAPGRSLKAEILGFNRQAGGTFTQPTDGVEKREVPKPATAAVLSSVPKSVVRVEAGEWSGWTRLEGNFARLVAGYAKLNTRAWTACDKENFYFAVEADEPSRRPAVSSADPYLNEHAEVILVRTDGKIDQFLVDAAGHCAYYLDHAEKPTPAGTVCRGEIVQGFGWRVVLAVSRSAVGAKAPARLKANVCRQRTAGDEEQSSWAPMSDRGFFDLKNYGLIEFN